MFSETQGEYWEYEYDLFNRLVVVNKSESGTQGIQAIVQYTYDANHMRVKREGLIEGTTSYYV